MKKRETNTIEEVAYKSKGYYSGLDYLMNNHPDDLHLRSCFEGVSFRNLARYIMFDRGKKGLRLDSYLKRPKRFVLISAIGKVVGVMVTVSLPEFYEEINCEDYVVIGAENMLGYNELLSHLSFTGKAEIVTFDAKQAKLVRSRYSVREIHYWSVFASKVEDVSSSNVTVRLMDDNDSDLARRLSLKLPEESSPLRSLRLQQMGLPYKNYILSSKDKDEDIIGICPYCTGACQISYLVRLQTGEAYLSSAAEALNKFMHVMKSKLVWRLRKSDITENQALITRSGFVELAKESHLHFG